MVISGGLVVAIPWITNFGLLVSAITFTGYGFGFLDWGNVTFQNFYDLI